MPGLLFGSGRPRTVENRQGIAGPVFKDEDAWEKITAGASLIQLYTGLVFEGPGIAKSIVNGLGRRVKKAGFESISEVVGINA